MHLDKGYIGDVILDNKDYNNLDSDANNDNTNVYMLLIQTSLDDSSLSNDDTDSEDNEELSDSNNAHTSGNTESNLLNANEEEDEVVNAIIRSTDINTNHPPPITTEGHVVDICFHPNSNMIAVANIVGDVYLYKYNNTETELVSTLEWHLKVCRDIEFNDSGTTAKDLCLTLTDLETEKLIRLYENAHEESIYTMIVIREHMFTTGDDDGVVKIWDLRRRQNIPLFSLKTTEDYVSTIVTNKEGKYLICASGDGCLTTFNIPGKKLRVQSVEYEEELICLGLFKSETKILVGTSIGKMYVYNWGEFGLHSDEFPNLTRKAINCMMPITENIVITGGEDKILRATSLFPHHHLGIVGEHILSIEALDVNSEDVKERVKGGKQRQLKQNLPSSKIDNAFSFFPDLQ